MSTSAFNPLGLTNLTSQVLSKTGATITTLYTSLGTLNSFGAVMNPSNGTDVPVFLSFDGVNNHIFIPVNGVETFLWAMHKKAWPTGPVYIKSATVNGTTGTFFSTWGS